MTTEVQNSGSTESTTTSSAASGASTASAGASTSPQSTQTTQGTQSQTAAPGQESTPGTVVPPAFTPNFKFKVMDKEHEIPEFLRGAIKDADTEKQLRELHEKAFGLDVVKPKYQSLKGQYDKIMADKESQDRSITILGKMIQNNDLDSFFKALKISEDQVLQYALERVRYREMPIEQRMQFDAQANERQRLMQLEMQNQQLQEQYMNESVQARTIQLDMGLANPLVKQAVDAFDAAVGKPGAFRAEVIKRGQYANFTTGADIPVDQAISEVMQIVGPFVKAQAPASAVAPGAAPAAGATPPTQQPPVIPNVSGRATSPAKRVAKSVDDLREMARAL